jgi:ribosome assembly protein 4
MSESNNHKSGGGIAWAGSLVGSQNPNNLGYRYSHAHKRYKRANDDDKEDTSLPSNVVVQFKNKEGEEVGNLIDIPTISDIDAMSALVNSLLNDDDDENDGGKKSNAVQYSFYAKVKRNGIEDDVEVTTTLANLINEYDIGTEDVIALTYQPLAVFKVRPVTRCTDTIPGHTEAVLHVSYSPDGK